MGYWCRNKNHFSHYVESLIVIWDSSDSNPLWRGGGFESKSTERSQVQYQSSLGLDLLFYQKITLVSLYRNIYFFRFNCMICLCPRLEMVSGYCQHRICTQCLYNEDNIRKPSLDKCPTCQKEEAFPVIR